MNSSSFKKLAAAGFFTTSVVVLSSSSAGVNDCPAWIGSGCDFCYMIGSGYSYYGCPEDCYFADWLCDEYCGGTSICSYQNGGPPPDQPPTCGECTC
jgi:hypothetical protein